MEKLQPVIKQIFWIFFALAMMLILVGWWKAQGELSTQIEDRQKKVDTAFSDAGKPVDSVPNARWTEGAAKENESHEIALERAAERLRQDQLSARVYPASIRDDINRIKFNGRIDDQALRERFGELYRDYFWNQLLVIKPFIKGEGLVDISEAKITQENEQRWKDGTPPTSKEIWYAQEDIWLLRSIYDSIAMVNRGAERIDKAPLRSLLLLQLRGGDPAATPGSSSDGGGGGFGKSEGGDYESGSSSFGGGYGGAGGAAGSGPWQAFMGSLSADLLTEEFGAVAGGGGGGGFSSSGGGYESGNDEDSQSSGQAAEEKRYVHDDDKMPYKTRAFVLQVKILQQDIPKLLAELTNSKFPVEIVRVDVSFGNSAMLASSSSSGYSGSSGGYESSGGGYESGGMSSAGMSSAGMSSAGMGGGGFGGGGDGYGGAGGAMGGGLGGSSGLGSARGLGPGPSSSSAKETLTVAERKKIAMGERVLADAMRDPDLSVVRVAGLMTMYRSKEENAAEAETENVAAEEAQQTSETSGDPGTNNADGPTDSENNPVVPDAEGDSVAPANDQTPEKSEATTPNENSAEPATGGQSAPPGSSVPEANGPEPDANQSAKPVESEKETATGTTDGA